VSHGRRHGGSHRQNRAGNHRLHRPHLPLRPLIRQTRTEARDGEGRSPPVGAVSGQRRQAAPRAGAQFCRGWAPLAVTVPSGGRTARATTARIAH
jgi:hypothetical protein